MKRALVVGLLLVGGCKKLEVGARERFAERETCPIDRVEAHLRPDLHNADFYPRETPSADIAADPERMKLWQANEDARRTELDRDNTMISVKGCGKDVLYRCHRHNKDWSYIMCSEQTHKLATK